MVPMNVLPHITDTHILTYMIPYECVPHITDTHILTYMIPMNVRLT